MSDDEKKAWLDHQRDRWNNWAGVLSRIKQDEQRWLNVAFLLYGALLAFFTGSLGGAIQFDALWRNALGLAISAVTIHAAAWAWTMQALNLRVQYYKSMARLFEAELNLGMSLPESWGSTELDEWRDKATLPGDSKKVEMLLLGGLVCATGVLATYRFSASASYYGLALIGLVPSIAGFAWPYIVYPWWDRKLLKDKLFQDDGPVRRLQDRASSR